MSSSTYYDSMIDLVGDCELGWGFSFCFALVLCSLVRTTYVPYYIIDKLRSFQIFSEKVIGSLCYL